MDNLDLNNTGQNEMSTDEKTFKNKLELLNGNIQSFTSFRNFGK